MNERIIDMIDTEDIIRTFKKKWWLIVIITALTTGLSAVKASKMVPSYQGIMRIQFSKTDDYMELYDPMELKQYNAFIRSFNEATRMKGFLEESLIEASKPVEEPKEEIVETPQVDTSTEVGNTEVSPENSIEGENLVPEGSQSQIEEQIPEQGEQPSQIEQPSTESETEKPQAKVEGHEKIAIARIIGIDDVNKDALNIIDEEKRKEIELMAQKIRRVIISGSEESPAYTLSISGIVTEGMEETVRKAVEVLNFRVKEYLPQGTRIKVVDDFRISTIMPNKSKVVMVGFAAGLILSIGLILVLDYLNDTVTSKEQLEKMLPVPVLGDLPLYEKEFAKEEKNNVNSKKTT